MKRNYFIVVLIFFIFFVISFLTNIIGPLVPEVIKGFSVSKGMAGLLNFSFFIAIFEHFLIIFLFSYFLYFIFFTFFFIFLSTTLIA